MHGTDRSHRRRGTVRVQHVVEALDIEEYLALSRPQRRRVDALLGPVGTRRLSGEALCELIDVFGAHSMTGAALSTFPEAR